MCFPPKLYMFALEEKVFVLLLFALFPAVISLVMGTRLAVAPSPPFIGRKVRCSGAR